MELKPGYKQTEVGTIPEEWKVKKLGELCTFTQGVQIAQSDQVRHWRDGYIRYLYIRDFFTNDFEWFVRDQYPSKIMAELDIMMVNTGSTAGMVFTGARGVLSNNAFRIRFDKEELTRDFLFAFLTSPATQKTIREFANAAAQPHVGHKNIAQVPIGFPEKDEQSAIATALSDVDALIGALDRLIAKKCDLKQAAMQQLLTGQTRLPGFSGEWKVTRLGDVVKITKGQLITEKDAIHGTVPVIAGGMKPAYFHNKPNRTGKTITVSASGANAGYVAFFDIPIFASDCSTMSEGNGYSIEFIYFQLQIKQEAIYKAQTGGAQPHIHAVDLMPLEVGWPPLPEQTAIAAVLFDMDAEIAALAARRDKTRALKQGMMQELLTGRTRLV